MGRSHNTHDIILENLLRIMGPLTHSKQRGS